MGYKPFAYASPLTGGMKQRSGKDSSGYQGEIALLTGSFLGHSHFALPMLDAFQTEVSRQGYRSLMKVADETARNFIWKKPLSPDGVPVN